MIVRITAEAAADLTPSMTLLVVTFKLTLYRLPPPTAYMIDQFFFVFFNRVTLRQQLVWAECAVQHPRSVLFKVKNVLCVFRDYPCLFSHKDYSM